MYGNRDVARRKVLLIEDNDGAREMLAGYLELENFTVQTARNGIKGLQSFRGWKHTAPFTAEQPARSIHPRYLSVYASTGLLPETLQHSILDSRLTGGFADAVRNRSEKTWQADRL